MASRNEWMSADEAAQRLGVKPATLYAYVSRGVLQRRRGGDGRSMFDAAEIERLARRGRPRHTAGASEVSIGSAVTLLGVDRPFYRGRDAVGLAVHSTFEEVAGWLWTGQDGPPQGQWRAGPDAVRIARAATAGLPAGVLPLERLQMITTALAVADPMRLTFEPTAVAGIGRSLIAGLVDALPEAVGPGRAVPAAVGPGPAGRIPGRLWAKLAGPDADPALADVVRVALILVADHELAAPTLAARIAASMRADPYAVVSTGLGATGGALNGGASLATEAMLAEPTQPTGAGQAGQAGFVMGQRLRRGERIPGFGHQIYRSGDARATALLDAIRAAVPGNPRMAVADAFIDEARRCGLPAVNVDFALGVLAHVAGMPRGAGEALFAVARVAGWLAHAMEEYAHPTQLRLRASYSGPAVDGPGSECS